METGLEHPVEIKFSGVLSVFHLKNVGNGFIQHLIIHN